MNKVKQIIIWVCLMLPAASCGFCGEDIFAQSFPAEINDKLEKLQIYFETAMYAEAASLLDELIAQFPQDLRFVYLRAIVDYQRGDYGPAEKVFLDFIREYPRVPEPYYLLGEISLKRNNRAQARVYFARYCELVPWDTQAAQRLSHLAQEIAPSNIIIKDGREDLTMVKKIGFYGGCIYMQEEQSLKLINGQHCNWSSMGIDFASPVDLRGKQIVLRLRGKQGGERFILTLRDKFASDNNPQLKLIPEQSASSQWQELKVVLQEPQAEIDLSSVVHMGLEFGLATAQNPPHSTLFVQDIFIQPR